MKKFALYAIAPLLLLVVSTAAEAQTTFGVRAGVTDGEPMLGVELLTPITGDIMFNPNIEASSEVVSANVDAHYDFDLNRRTSFWLGAGLAAAKPEDGDAGFGLNILGGIGTRMNRFYPYAQVKLTTVLDGYGSIAVGIRF